MTDDPVVAQLTEGLAAAATGLPPLPAPLPVGADDALRPEACPAHGFAPDGPFRWRATNARRRLGLGVLARLADPPPRPDEDLPDLVAATFDVLRRTARPEDGSLDAWLAGLDTVGTAVLRRAVVAWASGATPQLLPLEPGARIVLGGARTWRPPRGRFVLRAPVDVDANGGTAVVTTGRLGSAAAVRATAGCTALLAHLNGRAPVQVRVVVPGAGRSEVVAVDGMLLADAAAAYERAAATAVAALDGDDRLPRVTGEHCWSCPRRSTCEPGAAWLGERRRVIAETPR
ncbi:MAG: hypothetical protein FJW83_07245 [Actinobacteria bacterium]|nr:hypothetical protein [Actinomycetota bacterium]